MEAGSYHWHIIKGTPNSFSSFSKHSPNHTFEMSNAHYCGWRSVTLPSHSKNDTNFYHTTLLECKKLFWQQHNMACSFPHVQRLSSGTVHCEITPTHPYKYVHFPPPVLQTTRQTSRSPCCPISLHLPHFPKFNNHMTIPTTGAHTRKHSRLPFGKPLTQTEWEQQDHPPTTRAAAVAPPTV